MKKKLNCLSLEAERKESFQTLSKANALRAKTKSVRAEEHAVVTQPLSDTLNSAYNKVAFNEKLAIMKENLCTKYTPFTHKHIALNKKPPLMKQNLCIFFLL